MNFNQKFEFIFLKKIVKKLTAFFGKMKEKETNSLQMQSFVLN
ncbi:ABC transporter ATP-binding protein [Roseburia sp. AM23-20]|nr:ABC transporter ATP-binding protein [Roseburia sp. AM23-20]